MGAFYILRKLLSQSDITSLNSFNSPGSAHGDCHGQLVIVMVIVVVTEVSRNSWNRSLSSHSKVVVI